jgi:Rod binding domain-containing protein
MPDFSVSTTASASSALDARTESLRRSTRSQEAQDRAKLDKSATEFEAILLGQWLEDAHRAFATVPGSDPDKDSDPGADNFRSIGMQAVATSLANNGGIGIASMLVKYMNRTATLVDPGQGSAGASVPAEHERNRT